MLSVTQAPSRARSVRAARAVRSRRPASLLLLELSAVLPHLPGARRDLAGRLRIRGERAYEQAAGTALTATTLLLVALLKNAELRAEAAMQNKLDALATGMLAAIREERERSDADRMLERAIKIDEEL